MNTSFPSAGDYAIALQNPDRAFNIRDFKNAQFEHTKLGMPLGIPGSTAVVFKAQVNGVEQALRFFTRDDASSRGRYTAIHPYLTGGSLTHSLATAEWIDEAITVGGRPLPMIRMQWVRGLTLDKYVANLVQMSDAIALAKLAESWRAVVGQLQFSGFAHGDLQHGNVLVGPSGDIRLVDFDGVWVQPLAGEPAPHEWGHPNYQRIDRPWGPWMDTFSGMVIYTSLVALSKSTQHWYELYNGENLLFRRDDFRYPFQSSAWNRVEMVRDSRLSELTTRLKSFCEPNWAPPGPLEPLLTESNWWVPPVATPAREEQKRIPSGPPHVTSAQPGVQSPPGAWWTGTGPVPDRQQSNQRKGPPIPDHPQSSVWWTITAALLTALVVAGVVTGAVASTAKRANETAVFFATFAVVLLVTLTVMSSRRYKGRRR